MGAGFELNEAQAHVLLMAPEARYADVVRPFLKGKDLTEAPDQGPRQWIIDFADRTLEEAMRRRPSRSGRAPRHARPRRPARAYGWPLRLAKRTEAAEDDLLVRLHEANRAITDGERPGYEAFPLAALPEESTDCLF